MEILHTLADNPVYDLDLHSPNQDELSELYTRSKNFNNDDEYLNFCLNNLRFINYILKFAPFEKIVKLFVNKKLLHNYLSKILIDDIVNHHQNEFCLQKEKQHILLNNKFSMFYNFNIDVFKRRLKNFLPDCFADKKLLFGETMIHDICNNTFYKELLNTTKTYNWEIYAAEHFYIDGFTDPEKNNNKFYVVKHKNINYILSSLSLDGVLGNNLFCGDYDNIYASPLGYHTLANQTYIRTDKLYDIQSYTKNKILSLHTKEKITFHFNKNIHHHCYICKKTYCKQYVFPNYMFMCFECGMKNYKIEKVSANMQNMVAFITGIRHTIGFAIALKLLRSGCIVIGTSRFPMCALHNYQQECDYDVWKDRLIICQCDFLNMESVQKTITLVKSYQPHIIINNACQTVRPTKEYYQRVSLIETTIAEKMYMIKEKDTEQLCKDDKIVNVENSLYINEKWCCIENFPKVNTGIHVPVNFTRNICDPSLDPTHNSWTLNLQEVSMTELLEVNAINQITPTIIIQQLLDYMQYPSFVIQVSAKEGIFNTNKSTEKGLHAHTNMCKSGMNMLIRTLSETKKKNCNFYAVDPGYVSGTIDKEYPLSINDGAQRVIYPIISHINSKTLKQGHYKNYNLHAW